MLPAGDSSAAPSPPAPSREPNLCGSRGDEARINLGTPLKIRSGRAAELIGAPPRNLIYSDWPLKTICMKPKLSLIKSSSPLPAKPGRKELLSDVRGLILAARQSVAQVVNSTLTLLYWEIGRRIRQDVLQSRRAGYGEQIVSALGRRLEREFGRGFNEKNLWRTLQFTEVFPDRKIVVALIRELAGPIFCGSSILMQETVELLDLEQSGIRVSSYWTDVLPKRELERKLHNVVALARARLAQSKKRNP